MTTGTPSRVRVERRASKFSCRVFLHFQNSVHSSSASANHLWSLGRVAVGEDDTEEEAEVEDDDDDDEEEEDDKAGNFFVKTKMSI